MPEPQPQDWARAYARVQRLADRSLLAALRQALKDVDAMLRLVDPNLARVGDLVRIEQLQTVKRNLLNEQGKIFNRMGDIIAERRAQAAAAATALGSTIDDLLFELVGQETLAQRLKSSLNAGLAQTVDVAVTRMTVSAVPLSQRIYNSNVWANGVLQRRINSALLRGLSAREFAKEARDWFRPDTPGGVRYASFRLARTEINNAFHATSVLQAQEKPWISHMKWHLSRSHPKVDDCDRLAKGGPKGDGVYPKMDVPRKPHPQCFCFVTPVVPDEDDFLDGLVAGRYDQYLRDKMSGTRIRPQTPQPVKPKQEGQPKVVKAQPKPKPTPTEAPVPTQAQATSALQAKSTSPVPAGARPYHTNLDGIEDLARLAESTPQSVRALTGGVSAETELLTYANGTKLVRKSAGNPAAEHVSSMMGRSLGLPVPRTYRNHPSSVYMDYVDDAKTMAEIMARAGNTGDALQEVREQFRRAVLSDDGKVMGLFDTLVNNFDRNMGNWMLTNKGGRLIPIDHGHARPILSGGPGGTPRPLPGKSPFAEPIFQNRLLGGSGWEKHPFSAADLVEVRRRIGQMQPELQNMGQNDWARYAYAVLDKMAETVTSTVNLIAGVRPNLYRAG